jgi:hypothetical protein
MSEIEALAHKMDLATQGLRVVLYELFEGREPSKRTISEQLKISDSRLSAFAGHKGARSITQGLRFDEFMRVLDFVVKLSGDSSVSLSNKARAAIDSIEDALYKDTQVSKAIQKQIDLIKLTNNSPISDSDYKSISGTYLTFRWRPNQDLIVVSALEISKDDLGLVVWRNRHPQGDDTVPYSGIVVSQPPHILLVGHRNDLKFMNIIALRLSPKTTAGMHGLALAESVDVPVSARIYFLRRSESIEQLSSLCGPRKTVTECLELGLPDETFISTVLPENSDTKRSITVRDND